MDRDRDRERYRDPGAEKDSAKMKAKHYEFGGDLGQGVMNQVRIQQQIQGPGPMPGTGPGYD
jgi:hypothetical protein